jgi:hypothetical protein
VKTKGTGNDKGLILIAVLLLITIMTVLGLAANRNIIVDTMISSSHLSSIKAFYAADGAVQYGFNKVWQELQKLSADTSTITPPSLTGYSIASSSYVTPIGGVTLRPNIGDFDGLYAFVQRYRIAATATENVNNGAGRVVLEVEDQLIPIFQFGIFYMDDLEISPGANMTFTGGRIHSNKNIHLTANTGWTLSVDSKITSARSIFNTDKANRGNREGTVQIKDTSSVYQTLSIDSTDSSWPTASLSLWGGRIKNDVHGILALNPPLPTGGQAVDLIGTGTNSLYAKAGLRIIDGVAKNKNNNIIDIRYYDETYRDGRGRLIIDPGGTSEKNVNPIVLLSDDSKPTFYDQREQKTMTAVEINVAKLQNSLSARAALNDPPTGGDAGILYISSANVTNPVVRLTNGSVLDSTKLPSGLSVATDNPLYVKGDYNTANRPAAFFADAVTVLSGAWNDANSTAGIDSRVAANTTVKAAIMAGNRNTVGTDYSGGAENFIRFLEKWTGRTITYSGSLVCLWQSRQVTRKWPGTGSVYSAPTRDWSYGISYNNLPAGTPRVRNVARMGWRQVTQ